MPLEAIQTDLICMCRAAGVLYSLVGVFFVLFFCICEYTNAFFMQARLRTAVFCIILVGYAYDRMRGVAMFGASVAAHPTFQ